MDKSKQWEFSHPIFEYNEIFNDYDLPWTGHIFFAYDLICNLHPKNIVELGTFKGTSFFAFTQAVKDRDFASKLYAVDTWEGDENTGYYGDDIYEQVKTILRKTYRDVPTRLLRMTFDSALAEFSEGSIDVLHIDGLHTYEAVMHDYLAWKEKLSEKNVILFHDISVADYGVWKVWEVAKHDFPKGLTIEFNHSAGLGVLINDQTLAEKIRNLGWDMNVFTNYYKRKAHAHRTTLDRISSLEKMYDVARTKYKKAQADADHYITEWRKLSATISEHKPINLKKFLRR